MNLLLTFLLPPLPPPYPRTIPTKAKDMPCPTKRKPPLVGPVETKDMSRRTVFGGALPSQRCQVMRGHAGELLTQENVPMLTASVRSVNGGMDTALVVELI